MPARLIPFVILAWPLLEIAGFAWIGGQIGALATVGLVLLSLVAGLLVFRREGSQLMRRVQGELQAGRVPARQMADSFLRAVAGLLLILPGFFSDLVALALLFPPTRALICTLVLRQVEVKVRTGDGSWFAGGRSRQADVVDLDADDYRRNDGTSPWNDDPRRLP